jgi:hypothetical protein
MESKPLSSMSQFQRCWRSTIQWHGRISIVIDLPLSSGYPFRHLQGGSWSWPARISHLPSPPLLGAGLCFPFHGRVQDEDGWMDGIPHELPNPNFPITSCARVPVAFRWEHKLIPRQGLTVYHSI